MVAGGMGGWVERMLERMPCCVGSLYSSWEYSSEEYSYPSTRSRTRRRRLVLLLLVLQVAEVVPGLCDLECRLSLSLEGQREAQGGIRPDLNWGRTGKNPG